MFHQVNTQLPDHRSPPIQPPNAPPVTSPASNPSTHTKTSTYTTANPPHGTGRLYWFIPRFVRSPLIAWQPPPVTYHRHSLRRRRAVIVFVVVVVPFRFLTIFLLSTSHTLSNLYTLLHRWWCRWWSAADRNRPSSYPAKVRAAIRKMRGRVPSTFAVRAFYLIACITVAVVGVQGVQGTDDSLRSALEAFSEKLGPTGPQMMVAQLYLKGRLLHGTAITERIIRCKTSLQTESFGNN